MYLGKAAYVTAALGLWLKNSVSGILDVIESYWGEDKYSKIIPDLTKRIKKLDNRFRAESNAIANTTSNIANDPHPDAFNLAVIPGPLKNSFNSRITLILILKDTLIRFKAGKTLQGPVRWYK
ncbi:hypothetical protein BASA50_007143 [Batrachochytrium salamandrivorans]|uniref:Uncharacterized protein n=1 Tax=Batrachochytrium salamandrivorans TaxID=1357716 RepID=A0ABQ8F7S8_9FUNG|nr:hypothetical protein BASA62_006833 [Batrachochytrium salamandrivorans]KAH6576176.1 hypothetical protein BASA60_004644 [Batrachochytrium salamandrivorans]KAH6593707.1 hypothetical protein BASA50_007143 [Batrachochytrium salamandrivorans]KAH6601810.1 hypothetical protein BASA61_001752 [Batrachochytrium salamandrivorans]